MGVYPRAARSTDNRCAGRFGLVGIPRGSRALAVQAAHIVPKGKYGAFDLFGPTVEFLTEPEDANVAYCTMIGTLPAGESAPIHSHPDDESFSCCPDPCWRYLSSGRASNGLR